MDQIEQLRQAIAFQEQMRGVMPDNVIETAVAALKKQLAELEAANASAENQRKQVVILFADVSGFTALSETLDAEDVQGLMNELWRGVDGAILSYNGRIDKHIGDAVMALWGTTQAQEDDAEQAVRAALAMQAAVAVFGAAQNVALSLRIGLNYGPVLLGEVGSAREFTAMGDAVNVAARLEQAAPTGGVLISHDVYRQIRGLFDLAPQPPLTVKGKSEPLQTYLVKRPRPRAFRLGNRGVEGLETEMIGRAAELEQLKESLRLANRSRQAQLVTVNGDAGLGKSRLLYEFESWLDVTAELTAVLFKGRADLQRQGMPFALLRDLFYFRFQILDSDAPPDALAKLEAGCAEFMGEQAGREAAHFIAHLAGLDMGDSPYLSGILEDARQTRSRAFKQIAAFLTAVAANDPLVIFLEDAHWADNSSLELLDYLGRECADLPLLVLANARPTLYERRADWGDNWPRSLKLDLQPLSKEESRQLIAHILRKIPDLPQVLTETIVGNAEGNPFYVEELIKMLIDQGVILPGGDHWRVVATELTRLRIPPTLTGILQARLDRLSSEERRLMQRAAVVGRIFWDAAVSYLAELREENEIQHEAEQFADLQGKELIFQRPDAAFAGATEYVMKHAILHEVTYETVLKKYRAGYHRRAAEWLARQPQADAFAGLIAGHYERAGDELEMARWYLRAAQRATANYARDDARAYYERALDADEIEAAVKIECYYGLGVIAQIQANHQRASTMFDAALQAAQKDENLPEQARIWRGKSVLSMFQGDHRRALEAIETAEALLAQIEEPDLSLQAAVLDTKSWTNIYLGDVETALAAAEQGMAISLRTGSRQLQAKAYKALGMVCHMQSDYARAADYWQEGLTLNRELGDRYNETELLNNLGLCALAQGDFAQALAHYQATLTQSREVGLRHYELACRANMGAAQVGLRNYTGAAEMLTAVLAEAPEAWAMRSYSYRCLAEARLGEGEAAAALTAMQTAQQLAEASGDKEDLAHAWRVLGNIAALNTSALNASALNASALNASALNASALMGAEAAAYEADRCFETSVEIFTAIGMASGRALALWNWANYKLDAGETAVGQRLWQEARALYEELNLPAWVARLDESSPGRFRQG